MNPFAGMDDHTFNLEYARRRAAYHKAQTALIEASAAYRQAHVEMERRQEEWKRERRNLQ